MMQVDYSLSKINLYDCTGYIENADDGGEHCWFEFREVSYGVGKDWRLTLHTNAMVLCRMIASLPEDIPGIKETVRELAEKWAPDADLAEAFVKGVRQQAELLRKAEREAQIDECTHQIRALEDVMGVQNEQYQKDGDRGLQRAKQLLIDRIRELEAEGED